MLPRQRMPGGVFAPSSGQCPGGLSQLQDAESSSSVQLAESRMIGKSNKGHSDQDTPRKLVSVPSVRGQLSLCGGIQVLGGPVHHNRVSGMSQ